jgi:hypothetical protein
VICGIRNQNDLSDRSTTIPMWGIVKGGGLAPRCWRAIRRRCAVFPVQIRGQDQVPSKGQTLAKASESGIDLAKYKAQAFSTADVQHYVDANSK